MLPNARVEQLLEEMLDSGRTPEEIAVDSPELLEELRARWNHLQRIEAHLQTLFPPSLEVPSEAVRSSPQYADALAEIPGYHLTEILGRGGMGIVYRGTHRKLDRVVAIKMVLANRYATSHERALLSREAQAIAALQHPNIVQVYDVGEVDGRPYFTMEYIDGGTLAQRIDGAPMPVWEAAETIVILSRAIDAAHQRGIIHRDLKPANVLLTSKGTLKVSDFGLARRADGNDGVSLMQTGGRIGTPSYMAPEQALGDRSSVGPASDVYALGAILYEMLTGRPPFLGESPAETERQLLSQDPVAPSRLNARVPRDLETICLACLEKSPARRYESAGALADDLVRFQGDEPIAARRTGTLERGVKWARRHPSATTTLVAATVLIASAFSAAAWLVSSRAVINRAAESDLREAIRFQQQADWQNANRATDRAALRIGTRGTSELRSRIEQARRDSALVTQLDVIRSKGESIKYRQADVNYGDALRSAGIGGRDDPADVVAARIRDSNVKFALIDALDDWSCFSEKNRNWLVAVLRSADHDPTGWRDQVRDPQVWQSREALSKAAATAPYAQQPVPFLLSMATQLNALGEKPVPILLRVQQAHPNDFWINLMVGNRLADDQKKFAEAIGYLQAAVAIRPNAAMARNNLGIALNGAGRTDDAIIQFREAMKLEPESIQAQENLAIILSRIGRHAEAIPELEAVVRHDPPSQYIAAVYGRLGASLAQVGRPEEGLAALRKAVEIGPPLGEVQRDLQNLLMRQGRWEEAEAVWHDAIRREPARHESWDGYAEYCMYVGNFDEYKRVRRELLDRFANSNDSSISERTGRACLLLEGANDDIARAVALIDRALQSERTTPAGYQRYFMVAKSLADYRQGNFDAALSDVEGEGASFLRPMPQLITAMAHHRLGHEQTARRLLAEAVLTSDWRRENAMHDSWIAYVLRREAERLIIPNFNELIDGSAEPRDNDERLALLGACQFEDMRGRCAQIWTDAIAASPQLINNNLEFITRAVAMAGTGMGKDASKFTDDDRARWRQTALELISTRLQKIEAQLDSAAPPIESMQKRLLTLQQSPDLAGLREPAAIARLPKPEQDRCAAIWTRVRDMLLRCKQ